VALSEAANNPASLVTGKRTIGVEFMLINPLASHNVRAGWAQDETPGVVADEGLVLIRHGSTPLGVGESAPVVPPYRGDGGGDEGDLCRGRRWRRWRREPEAVDGLQRAGLLPSDRPARRRRRLDVQPIQGSCPGRADCRRGQRQPAAGMGAALVQQGRPRLLQGQLRVLEEQPQQVDELQLAAEVPE